MEEQIIDYTNMLINYKGETIYIVIDDNDEPWLKAKDVAILLGYENVHRTIQVNVSERF